MHSRSHRLHVPVLVVVALGAVPLACDDPGRSAPREDSLGASPAGPNVLPQRPDDFQPAPPVDPRALELPVADDGTLVLSVTGDVEVRYDPNHPRTPLNTHLTCLHWLTECHDATGGASS